jgi:hypothetical protein
MSLTITAALILIVTIRENALKSPVTVKMG